MAVDTILYQKRVGTVRLEIAHQNGETLGSIYYESPDGRFEDGHLDLALAVVAAILEHLRRREPLERVFVGPFEPVVPSGSAALEDGRAVVADLQARLEGHRAEALGPDRPLRGTWLAWDEALAWLQAAEARSAGLSLEASALRLVLMGPQDGAGGWDLMHRDGGTHLGRWDGNSRERPVGVEASGRSVLQSALEAARAALERRLGGA